MATKKQRKAKEIKAKKKKQSLRLFILSLIILVGVGFLVFFFLTLFQYMFPAGPGTVGTPATREKQKVTLYFADANERFLIPETRYIPKARAPEDQVRELVEALIKGPSTNLVETIPEETRVTAVTIEKDGTARISFNNAFILRHPGGSASEMMTVYSLANTVTLNLPGVKRVQILVEGKEIETIKGHIDTRYPFENNKELIVESSA